VFRTDNGGEFTSAYFAEYLADQGVERHHSAPHTPQQNARGGAVQPVGGAYGACPAEAEGHAAYLLGRGGEHGGVPPQLLVHPGPLRRDLV
jgi:hypothetical protein